VTPEALFSASNTLALAGWLLLIFAPRWRWTDRLVLSGLLPLLLATTYVVLVAAHFRPGGGGFGSLAQVSRLFENPHMLLAGWVHYLAFDLFVGAWEVRDARRRAVRHPLLVPCLVLTFLLGPAGLLLYFVVRAAAGRPSDSAGT